MRLVDADKLIANIEGRISNLTGPCNTQTDPYGQLITDSVVGVLESIISFINSMQKESVSEDLEEEFDHFLTDVEGTPRMWRSEEQQEWGKSIARHFANWQKQKCEKELREFFNERNQGDASFKDLLSFKEGVQIGREEMKQQMLKGAVLCGANGKKHK